MAQITREDALEYHRLKGKPGKIAVVPTKPMDTGQLVGQLSAMAQVEQAVERLALLAHRIASDAETFRAASGAAACRWWRSASPSRAASRSNR